MSNDGGERMVCCVFSCGSDEKAGLLGGDRPGAEGNSGANKPLVEGRERGPGKVIVDDEGASGGGRRRIVGNCQPVWVEDG